MLTDAAAWWGSTQGLPVNIVDVTENTAKGIWVIEVPSAAGVAGPKAVAEAWFGVWHQPFEEVVLATSERRQDLALLVEDFQRLGVWYEGPDDQAFRRFMRPEDAERIAITCS